MERKGRTYEHSKEGEVKGLMSVAEKAGCESRGAESKFCTREGAGPPEDEQVSHDGAASPASIWELEGEEVRVLRRHRELAKL